jgi:hypothetical protein
MCQFISPSNTGELVVKKFIFYTILFSILSICVSAPSYAGDSGHGGGGFLCNNPQDNELLDLWEGALPIPFGYQLHIPANYDPIETQLKRAMDRLQILHPFFAKAVQAHLDIILNNGPNKIKFQTPPGYNLLFPSDTLSAGLKEGCKPVGLADYTDKKVDLKDVLLIDQSRIDQLPLRDQAALWLHEAIYKELRDTQKDKDSVYTRHLVALLFSDETIEGIFAKTISQKYVMLCESQTKDSIAYMYPQLDSVYSIPDTTQKWSIHPVRVKKKWLMNPAVASLYKVRYNETSDFGSAKLDKNFYAAMHFEYSRVHRFLFDYARGGLIKVDMALSLVPVTFIGNFVSDSGTYAGGYHFDERANECIATDCPDRAPYNGEYLECKALP